MACILALPSAQRSLPEHTGPALERWLSGQQHLIEGWIEQLVSENGDVQLIGVLDQHLRFLREAQTAALSA
jgi:hypothetical protein